LKNIGEVQVRIPRDRKGEFSTNIIPKSKQYEEEIARDLSLMYLTGISTRSLSMISRRLIGRNISSTEISNANQELSVAVEQWRMRDLSKENIKYIILDGVNNPGIRNQLLIGGNFSKISRAVVLMDNMLPWESWMVYLGLKKSSEKNFLKQRFNAVRFMLPEIY
jgi:hypothetical protein